VSIAQKGCRDESAAELLIERLRDPSMRASALAHVQSYFDVPMTERQKAIQTRWRELVARPAVKAEIDKVGRVLANVPFAAPID
jgi:hypothetical protein